MAPTPIDASPTLDASERAKALLQRLHADSLAQEAELSKTSGPTTVLDATLKRRHAADADAAAEAQRRFDDLMRDKMVALEQDKAFVRLPPLPDTSFGLSNHLSWPLPSGQKRHGGGERQGSD